MANAKKCDICGVFYEPYNTGAKADLSNTVSLAYEDCKGQRWTTEMYDCCPECMYEIVFLIEMVKTHGMCDPTIIKDKVVKKYSLPVSKYKTTLYDALKESLEADNEHN